jgi:hypothetical protein
MCSVDTDWTLFDQSSRNWFSWRNYLFKPIAWVKYFHVLCIHMPTIDDYNTSLKKTWQSHGVVIVGSSTYWLSTKCST